MNDFSVPVNQFSSRATKTASAAKGASSNDVGLVKENGNTVVGGTPNKTEKTSFGSMTIPVQEVEPKLIVKAKKI
jgi:hypothetical protein